MTSTASQQHQTPAPNSSSTAAASYASAAGATKKSTTAPVIAAGTNPPLVVGSSVPAAQNGKSSTASPVNGRPNIAPAVPAVVHGSNLNGAASDHTRKSSVTISANAPASHIANGASAPGSRASIQFGFNDSPAIAHSTPQPNTAAPIPIPGGNPRIASPAHSPSPIPQPSASGGRPPSGAAHPNQMTFGSFPGEGDRHVKQPALPHNPHTMGPQQVGNHARRDSQASAHGEMGGHGGHGPNRGGFQGQAGRGGRNNFNQSFNGQPHNYGPGRYPGPNGGRGGSMGSYQPNRGGYSPQPHRASPALSQAVPHHAGTPNMPHAAPMPAQQYYPQPPMYPPQMGPHYPQMNMDPFGRGMMAGGYPYQPQHVPYMGQPPQPGAPNFNQQYPSGHFGHGPQGGQPMSRNSSQISERPASSTGQHQTPVIPQGTPQPRPAQAVPPTATPPVASRPRSSKIVIKDSSGQIVNFDRLKGPASPAPSSQQSKTPPVVASTPTPPPKPSTPSTHSRAESIATNKTAEQVRNEFIEQVKKTAKEPVAKTKEEQEPALASEKPAVSQEAKDAPPSEEIRAAAGTEPVVVSDVKDKEQAKPESGSAPASTEKKGEETEIEGETEDEKLDRIIREMEEADAKREKEQEELTRKKKLEAEEAKKRADELRAASAAENDKKLREQEAEMEALMERREEERKKQREQKEGKASPSDKTESAADVLAKKIEDLKLSDKKDNVTEKLANLTINNDRGALTPAPRTGGSDKPKQKPAALNLVVNTKPAEPPQPSAALQSLRSARFLDSIDPRIYPADIASPNPALNAAVSRKGKTFKYDAGFLLQFQKVFTEQPSVEFHQQVKSLIGDPDGSRSASVRTAGSGSGRQGSKAGTPGGFPSGVPAMGQFGAKTLPPGTTSEQRFAMSQGSLPRPAMANPMASFGRPGAFPGSQSMSRNPSSTAMGGIPNSPRQGSRRGGGSKRGDYSGAKEAQNAKNMPLTQGMDLKPITISATGWKPSSVGNKAAQGPGGAAASGHLDPEVVQRKVKAALNKMTPEKFDKISDQILAIAGQSKDEQDGRTLRQVIQLTFEKATDEAHWASMYAKFCKRMLDTMSSDIRDENILDKQGNVVSGGALFRKYLLNRCQEEFERGWKVDLPEPKEGEEAKTGEAALLSDEYYVAAAAKRRGLGLVQFIGELYKLSMLTERIMHECVRKLLEFQGIPDEAEIESLTKLLRTIGANLDSTDKGRPMMDAYFQRIQSIVDLPDLPSRLRFMLMDVVDLRRARWTSKEANKGPKTLEEVRAEAEAQAAQKAAESARSHQRGAPGGRPHVGRGDSRNFSGYNQPVPNQVGMDDLRRLKGSANRSSSQNVSFGPTSMFNSRSNSGRRLAPGGSFGRAGEDSGASSRTGTPPTRERDSVAHTNAFGVLANTGDHPGSPPSAAASPALSKVALDTSANSDAKKES